MKRMLPVVSIRHFHLLLALLLLLPAGCGGGQKTSAKKDYGEPTWLKVDSAQLAPLSEDATSLEGGKITVYDPEGWERQPRGAAKPPKGFKSVIVFKKDGATILMTKSEKAKDLPDLDEDNIEEFAENAQQLFKSKVQMLKLGSLTGVLFSKRVADAQRLSKFYDRRIVATSIHGQLFTFELVTEKGKVDRELMNALYAIISKTEFEGMEPAGEEESGAMVAATETPAETAPKDEPAEAKAEEKPVEVVAAKPETPAPEASVGEVSAGGVSVEKMPEEKPVTEIAAVSKNDEKPAPPKASVKKPAKKKPAKKADTKAILNELDALLN